MDTEELARSVAAFEAAVSDGPYPAPQAGEWSAEMVLAHAAAVNRLVAHSVASAIDGECATYSNRVAGNGALLRAIVAGSGGTAELKAEVIRTGHVLIHLAAELGPDAASPIDALVAEGDIVHVDGPVPALALIASTLGYHLGVHREQLAALGSAVTTDTRNRTVPSSSAVSA
jgi:hypothetical protein